LTLGSINKNEDTHEPKSIRARRECESERARQSRCRLSVACETQTKYSRQKFKRQETRERLQQRDMITESYGKQQQKLLKQMHHSVQKIQ